MLMWSPKAGAANTPVQRQMFDFERVAVGVSETEEVSFTIDALSLQLVDPATGNLVSAPGKYKIEVTTGNEVALAFDLEVTGDHSVLIEEFPTA